MTPLEHVLTGLAFCALREADSHTWQLDLLRRGAELGFARRITFGPGLSPQWELTEEGIVWLSARRRAERDAARDA